MFLSGIAWQDADAATALEQKLAAAPAADPEWDWIWEAWWRLNDDRHTEVSGMGMPMGGTVIQSRPRRIPWTAVDRWCERYGYGQDQSDLFDECLMAMDAVYIRWFADRQKEAT